MAWGREVGSKGTEGPAFLVSSLVIKSSSECKAEAHSPAEPSGRMRRGFHGYHSEKENIQIKPESKVHPVLQPKPGMQGQGCRAATQALPAPHPRQWPPPTWNSKAGGGESRGLEGSLCPPAHCQPSARGAGHQASTLGRQEGQWLHTGSRARTPVRHKSCCWTHCLTRPHLQNKDARSISVTGGAENGRTSVMDSVKASPQST